MKLIYCPSCHDVVALRIAPRICECGKSGGHYLDDRLRAAISGEAIPIGFANSLFRNALKQQPERGPGKLFEAFVIEKNCPTITRE